MTHCRRMITLITILLLSAAEEQIYLKRYYTGARPIINEDLGLALVPSKILASGSGNLYQSIFLKIDIPQLPEKKCNVDCNPDYEELQGILDEEGNMDCWVPKMKMPSITTIRIITSKSNKPQCFGACLQEWKCNAITFDEKTKKCSLITGQHWSETSVNETSTSASVRLECLMYDNGHSREKLCKTQNPIYETLKVSMTQYREHLWEDLIARFADVRKSYDLNGTANEETDTHPDRSKRSLDELLRSIPVISHFYGIFASPWENRKIKEHLAGLSSRFDAFVLTMGNYIHTNTRFQHEILEIYRKETAAIYEYMGVLGCEINSVVSALMYQNLMLEHQRKITDMFNGIIQGKLISQAVPILTIRDIETIIENNPVFQKTIYKETPELLLRLADLILVKVVKSDVRFTFHYILAAPNLADGSLYQTYSPVTVPLTIELPDVIFRKSGLFYKADISSCSQKNDIWICLQHLEDAHSPSISELQCLNEELEECPTTTTECTAKMRFTKSGALVFSTKEILGMRKEDTHQLTLLSTPNRNTYFFEWSSYSMIQSAHKIIYALDHFVPAVLVKWTPKYIDHLHRYLQTRAEIHASQNTTNLSLLLKDTSDIILSEYTSDFALGMSKDSFFNNATYISLGITALSVLIFIVMCGFKTLKKYNSRLQTVLAVFHQQKHVHKLQKTNRKRTAHAAQTMYYTRTPNSSEGDTHISYSGSDITARTPRPTIKTKQSCTVTRKRRKIRSPLTKSVRSAERKKPRTIAKDLTEGTREPHLTVDKTQRAEDRRIRPAQHIPESYNPRPTAPAISFEEIHIMSE